MIKKYWSRYKKRIESWGKETDVFLTVFELSKHKSNLTWKIYTKDNLQSFQFAHILPKGMYPEYRLNPNNIIFVDSLFQHEWVDKTVCRIWKAVMMDYINKGIAVKMLKFEWDCENNPFLVKIKNDDKHNTERKNTIKKE